MNKNGRKRSQIEKKPRENQILLKIPLQMSEENVSRNKIIETCLTIMLTQLKDSTEKLRYKDENNVY